MTKAISIGDITIGGGNPLVLIAGPCVIESEQSTLEAAERLKRITADAGIALIFKSSFDKANRSSINSFRGPGIDAGLKVLARVKKDLGLPILSDVHRFEEIAPAAKVLDIIQVPAFLSRQTDLLLAVAATGRVVNIKKGQFLAPWDMRNNVEKVRSAGNDRILLTERGVSFGYNNLVVDMRALPIMRELGYPVVFDATHAVQMPGGAGTASSGDRKFVPPLTLAAVAAGIDALFMEVHECPDKALCDGPNMLSLDELPALLRRVRAVENAIRTEG